MSEIKEIYCREILDSRGLPTLEVDVTLACGSQGRASVPSGASKGKREVKELRDGEVRYRGRGVLQAVNNVNSIITPALIGLSAEDQTKIDNIMIELDGSDDKAVLGGNAILSVSLAVSHAMAEAKKLPLFRHIAEVYGFDEPVLLPTPMMNIVNGGMHADNNIDFQEFMIQPVGFDKFSEALRCGSEIFHTLKQLLRGKELGTGVGDEGGFAPNLSTNEEAIEFLLQAIEEADYEVGKQVLITMDFAASEFYRSERYALNSENQYFSSLEWVEYIEKLLDKYPMISSMEDCLDETDWKGWGQLTERVSDRVQLVGDDIFVTSSDVLRVAIEEKVGNAILIKPNQIGTLTEAIDAIKLAKENNYKAVISHRSGETTDVSIADIAVATSAGQIKTGGLCRSERIAKYNRLLEIEGILGDKAVYAGKQ